MAKCDKGGRVARRICALSSKARSHLDPVGLNPCFALEMMGYPAGWQVAMEQAMQSFHKPLRTSSRRPSKH